MGKHVGIFEAKTNLSSLVDEVEKGGEITITRHGKPVAKLVAHQEQPAPEVVAKRRQALLELREMATEIAKRSGKRLTIEEIKSWIEEGRR
jgi:prevent-host-death family protein